MRQTRAELQTERPCPQCGAARSIKSLLIIDPDDVLPDNLCAVVECVCGVAFPLPFPKPEQMP